MRIAALLVIVAAFSTSAYAQFDSGQITGFVRDPQQGALPGTTVTATNVATSNARTTVRPPKPESKMPMGASRGAGSRNGGGGAAMREKSTAQSARDRRSGRCE